MLHERNMGCREWIKDLSFPLNMHFYRGSKNYKILRSEKHLPNTALPSEMLRHLGRYKCLGGTSSPAHTRLQECCCNKTYGTAAKVVWEHGGGMALNANLQHVLKETTPEIKCWQSKLQYSHHGNYWMRNHCHHCLHCVTCLMVKLWFPIPISQSHKSWLWKETKNTRLISKGCILGGRVSRGAAIPANPAGFSESGWILRAQLRDISLGSWQNSSLKNLRV